MALKLSISKLAAGLPRPPRGKEVNIGSLRALPSRLPKTVKNNIERYIGLVLGFFLFVAPFAVFTWFAYSLTGTEGEATIHSICYRLPLDWLTGGSAAVAGPIAAAFVIGVLVVALLFGPLFCGRLCPVGAFSEFISRIVPLPAKYRMRIRDTRITASLRYGFLAGFIIIGLAAGGQVAECSYGVDLGRYCSSSILEFVSLGMFGGAVPANYWNTGLLLTLFAWLGLGGVMMVGGRGWCLFFCPLGALSGLSHALGARLGLYHIRFEEDKCKRCRRCEVNCPMWAIGLDRKVEPSLCMGCRECLHNCSFKAYRGGFGRSGARISESVKDLLGRIRSSGTFVLATSTAPVAAIITGPCASVGCGACPLGGMCAIGMPLIFGGMLVAKRSLWIRERLSSLWERMRRARKD